MTWARQEVPRSQIIINEIPILDDAMPREVEQSLADILTAEPVQNESTCVFTSWAGKFPARHNLCSKERVSLSKVSMASASSWHAGSDVARL